MANGYGSSSSSTSTRQNVTNAQGQIAPPGFHYMPDGTLMSDAEHARLYGDKIIRNFNLDLSDLPACLLYTSPSPRDGLLSRMPSSA